MAEKSFCCPSCTAVLNQHRPDRIGLSGVLRGPGFSVTIPIDVPSELGEYGADYPDSVALDEGCVVDFLCPRCGHDFTTTYSPGWAELKMVEGAHEYVVVFNKTYGEQRSFVFDYATRKLVGSFGDSKQDYVAEFGKDLNFFGS